MKYLVFLSFFLLSLTISAQIKKKKADFHFGRLEFVDCAPIYAEIGKKAITGKDKNQWEAVSKAAYSYKQLFQYNKARYYYSKLHETNRLTELEYVEYIDLLRTIGMYDIAQLMLDDAIKVYPSNNFVALFQTKNTQFDHLLADSAIYSINPMSFNSGIGDFCPTFYEKGIMYMSKAKNAGFLNAKYGWDNSNFINMLYSEYDLDSTMSKGKVVKDAFFSRAHDGPVSFSTDGTKMVITKNTLNKTKDEIVVVLAIYFAEKVNGKWSELKPFTYNNKNYNVGHACFSSDGNRIYFASEQPGGIGGADLYSSDYKNGEWTEPVSLGSKINTDQDELFPFATSSTLYFSSKGHYGLGGLDVFTTPIASEGQILNMGFPINTSYDDFGIIALGSDSKGFLSSNRGDFIDRIYEWEKKDPIIQFEGNVSMVYDSLEFVPNQKVIFSDLTTNITDTILTDEAGNFKKQLYFRHQYTASTTLKYFNLNKNIEIDCTPLARDTTVRDTLFLLPTKITVNLKVIEKGTNKVLPNAKIIVQNDSLNVKHILTSDKDGLATITIERFTKYDIYASKRGYVDDYTIFTSDDQDGKTVDLLLQLPLIKKGDKFKLENIFYDYNKSTLRPESAASLDKLAAFLLENKLKIELGSHTDARGSNPNNQKLSQARAQSCVDYLIKKGVPKSSIVAKGYGETVLINKCKDGVVCTEIEHQANRRTEVKIL